MTTTTTTTSSKIPWIKAQSNDSSTNALDIGLATMSLSSSVGGRPGALSVSSQSSTGAHDDKQLSLSAYNGRDNDDLDYSTCSESGDDASPSGRNGNTHSYLSPIGKVTSTHSSPLRRSSSALDPQRNSDLFGRDSLYFMEVRSSSGLGSKQQDAIGFNNSKDQIPAANALDNLKDLGNVSKSNDCSYFDASKMTPVSDMPIRRKEDLSPSSFSNNDFPYATNSKESDSIKADLSFADNYDPLTFSSSRNRANSVPILPLISNQNNISTEHVQTGGIPPLPATGTWQDSSRNNNLGRNKVYDDNSSKSLLEGLRLGSVPVEDKSKSGLIPMKPAHVKSYSSDLSTSHLFHEKNYNSLVNNTNVNNSTRISENAFVRSNSREGINIGTSANEINSYSHLSANTEFSRHNLRHSLSDIPARGHEHSEVRNIEQDDAIARSHPYISDNNGSLYRAKGTPLNAPNNGVYKATPQQQQRVEYNDNNVLTGNMIADNHGFEESPYYNNRNSHHQYVEDDGARMDPSNFGSQQPLVQQHSYSETRSYIPNSCPPGSEYQAQSLPKHLSPYGQPSHPNIHAPSPNAYHYPSGQGDNYGLQSRGSHDQHLLNGHKHAENPQRIHHTNDRHRNNTSDARYEPSQQYRLQNSNHGPPPQRIHSATPPPLAPRTSYGDEFDAPVRMNRGSGGHHRVLSFNSAVNHSHGGVPVHQHRMPQPEVAENRVRCHSYGGHGTMMQEPNLHRGDVMHAVVHPPRYDSHQVDHRTMMLQEPVLMNNESEFFGAGSCGSHPVDPNAMHPTYHMNSIPRQDYHSNCDVSASSRGNSFVSARSEIHSAHVMSSGGVNQVPMMVRSISNQSNDRIFGTCSPPYIGAEEFDEVGMPISNMHHPQIVVAQGSPLHYNRPHSNSCPSIDRIQGIVPQFVGSEASSITSSPRVVYNIKFKRTQRSFIPGPRAPREIKIGCYVKVEADRGEDLGFVVSRMPAEKFNASSRSNFRAGTNVVEGIDSPGGGSAVSGSAADLKRVTRLATREEVALLAAKREEEDELLKICRTKVKQRGLSMNVVDAEYQFDRHKLTFFFEAEGRIDFRELVRDLFSIYKTRIWMQQLDKNGVGVVSDNSLDDSTGNVSESFPLPEVVINTEFENDGEL